MKIFFKDSSRVHTGYLPTKNGYVVFEPNKGCMMHKAFLYVCFVIMLLIANNSKGQLVRFVFNGLPGGTGNFGPSPFSATSSNANLTIGGLTRGSGVGTSGTAAANGWGGTGFIAGGQNGAITNNTFVSFSITANTGYKVSFSDIPVYNVRRSNSGPPNGLWQYKVGAGSFTDIGSTINWGGGSSSGNDQAAISLSGIPALQNVPEGTTVTFRIVSWGGSNSSGTWYLYDPNNNRPLDVNGTVEPVCTVSGTGTATAVCSGNSDAVATISVTSFGAGFPGTYTLDGGAPQAYNSNPFTIPGLSAGNHSIEVTVTGLCASNPFIVNVPENPLPVVSFSGLSAQICANASPVILTGSPSGGTFSGPGIVGNVFDPGSAGSGGPYNIIYSYTDPGTGCSNSSTQQVTINAIPTISISAENDSICMGGTSNLSLNFTGAGPWKYSINSGTTIETSNNPEIIPVNPLITTNYQVTYFSDVNCIANSWSKISTGGYHSLAIKTGGTLWSWGNNNDGQLGIGNNMDTNIAVQIGTANNWLKVATTANSSYAIKIDGTLWAWGENFYGQLGIGNNVNSNIPIQVGIDNDWKEVAGGNLHALAIKNNGTIWAWGRNISGQLGDGTVLDKNSPVQIGIATNWVEISAGTSHSLGRKADGSIWSWGSNEYGQTGTGTASLVPIQLAGNSWASISAGADYSMAIQTIGTLLGWGRNSHGQLGVNSYSDVNFPTEEYAMSIDWSKMSASSSHSLAIRTNGTLWAWGQNNYGEFGNGTLTDSNVPIQVGSDNDWSEISTGLDNSTAIKTNGTLWNWGRNNDGQLGDGTNINRNSPVQTGLNLGSVTITVITLPIVSFTGLSSVYCLNAEPVILTGNPSGGNFSGPGISGNIFNPALAGEGSEYAITYTYTDVITGCTNSAVQQVSVNALPVVGFTGLASQYCITSSPVSLLGSPAGGTFSGPGITGNIFTPALSGSGGPYTITYTYQDIATSCSNTYSQQVTVSAIPSADITASPVSICPGNSSNLSISFTGIGPWTYSINETVSVTTSSNPEIIPVNPLVTTKYKITSLSNASCISNGWVSLSAQLQDSHGIKTDGSLWGWGRNSNSELGDGSYIDKNYPIKIGTSNEWKQISTGELYTLAIKNDGTLWGWGLNIDGQLGDGTNVFKSTPVQIGTASDWAKVNACMAHSLGIKTDGTLWAWGLNNNSQLGDGTNTNRSFPVQIGSDTDWKIITGGTYHSLALKTNGTLWGWGYGSVGGELLGEGTSSIVPVQRGTDTDWSFISGNRTHTLGIKTNGTLWAWGDNFYGQLGNGTVTSSTITQIGAETWANVFATSYHSLGIRQDGTLWAWGLNDDGELGDGTTLTRTLPVPVGTDNDWVKLNGGNYYSMAIKSNGSLWTWGDNFFGQLGDKSNTDKYGPVQIKSDFDSVTVTVNPLPTVSFSGLLQFHCADQPPAILTGSPAGGIFSGPGMAGNIFNPAMAGVGGPYTITYSYTNPITGCTNNISKNVQVLATSPLSFTGLATEYCVTNAPVTLTGSDPFGGFEGPGITGNVFNPALAGVGGPYTITYYTGVDPDGDINCSNSITKQVTVTSVPAPTITGINYICFGGSTLLTANVSPESGSISSYQWVVTTLFGSTNLGNDVTQYTTMGGTYTVTVTSNTGCTATSPGYTVTTYDEPVVSFTGLAASYCSGEAAVTLIGSPSGGIFNGPGISGNTFNPALAGTGGPYTITYTFAYPGTTCGNSSSQIVMVTAAGPVSFSGLATQYCVDANAVILTGSPVGGTFSGPGISGNTFNPALAGIGGPYMISYSYTDPGNGCISISSQSVTIIANVTTISGLSSQYCVNAPVVTLTGSPAGGIFNGPGIIGNVFDPAMAGVGGPFTITYTNPNCGNIISQTVSVINIPTIESTSGATRCGTGTVTLGATSSSGSDVYWYASATGGSPIGTGSSFTTPIISSTTSFYAKAYSTNQASTIGVPASGNSCGVIASSTSTDWPLRFNTFQPVTLQSAWVIPQTSGTFTVALRNALSTVNLQTAVFSFTTGEIGIPKLLNLNFEINTPGNYQITNISGGVARIPVFTNLCYPFTTASGNFSIIGSATLSTSVTNTSTYNSFFDLTVTEGCESARTEVLATVTPAPPISANATNLTVCSGSPTAVSVTSSNPDYTYSWSSIPAGFTATGAGPHTVNPTVNTSFQVLATDNTTGNPASGCGALALVSITTFTNNLSLLATATPAVVCAGSNVQLNVEATSGSFTYNSNCGISFIDISGTGTSVGTLADDSEHAISIPSFNFNGTIYNSALAGTNGLIVLGAASGQIVTNNAMLPSSSNSAGNIFIAPYWDDLDIQTGATCKTQSIGDLFIIQYTNLSHNNFTTGSITFQVQLNLVTGVITYVYQDVVFGNTLYDAGGSATIGIQMGLGNALQYSFNTASLVNGQSICFTPSAPVFSYDWSASPAFLNAINISNPLAVAVTSSQNYEVKVTEMNSGCIKTAPVIVTVNPLPAIDFTGLALAYCISDAAVTLTGTPAGGTFSGPGISGNTFDPAASGAGTHIITYTYTDINGCTSNESQQVTVTTVCTPTLNLTAFLEGFYYDINTMRANIYDLGISTEPSETDTLTVNLWSPSSLANTEPDHTVKAVLHTDGTASMQFPAMVNGNAYYIAIRHRNHMETWSKLPVTFTSSTSYDFSDDMQKAYDDGVNPPMVAVAGGKYAIYGGDVNQDGTVDASDMADVDNDNAGFAFGYNLTDVNGDGATDASDISIIDNNQALFLFYARPY